MRVAVWCEFMPYAEAAAWLPALAKRRLGLHLAIQPERAEDPALFELLRDADAMGVEVRAWVLLGKDEGYWPNAWNAGRAAEAVRGFAAAARAARAPVPWVVLDLEPPPERMQALGERLGRGDWRGAWRLLQDPEVPAGSCTQAAHRIYADLIADLQARGTRVQAVTLPMALDGPAADRLVAALGIPLAGLAWDEVSFMAYRPEFVRLAGPMGADLVARYARAAVRRHGERASLAIGEVGTPGFPVPVPGYTDPADLQADLAACRAAGLPAASIFSLDGLVEQGGLERWLDAPPQGPPRPEIRPALLRLAIGAACRLLPRPLGQ